MSLDGKKILVFGATGTQGGIVATELARRGAIVFGASRSGKAVPAGSAVQGDLLGDPSRLGRLARELDGAFVHLPLTFGAPGDGDRVRDSLSALLESGIRSLVFSTSGPLPETPIGVPPIDDKIAIAAFVAASGRGVVLRPTVFMENLSAAWSAPRVLEGELLYPLAETTKLAFLTNRDVGAATARALSDERFHGRSFTLAGPEVLDFGAVADRLTRALERPVTFRRISGSEYGRSLAPHVGEAIGAMIGGFYDSLPPRDDPALAASGVEAARTLGFAQTSLEDWARTEKWVS